MNEIFIIAGNEKPAVLSRIPVTDDLTDNFQVNKASNKSGSQFFCVQTSSLISLKSNWLMKTPIKQATTKTQMQKLYNKNGQTCSTLGTQ